MKRPLALAAHVAVLLLSAVAWAQGLPAAAPEDVGLSSAKETGLGFVTGTPGEYRWAGAAGTSFWVDPKEQMVVVWMTQGPPGPRRAEDRGVFRQVVMAAIAD